jgi:hypothetical protein
LNAESRPTNGTASTNLADRPFAYSKHTGDIDLLVISEGSDNPRYAVYLSGWAAGWESQQAEIDRLNWQLDLIYFLYNSPGKTGADFYAQKTRELWDASIA